MGDKRKATSRQAGGQGNDPSSLADAHPKYSTNGHHETASISEADIEGAFTSATEIAAAELLDAAKVGALLELALTFEGNAQFRALEAVKTLIGHLPASERTEHALTKHLYKYLKTQERVEQFLADCPKPPGAPKFQPRTLADLVAMPPKQWLIDQIFGRGDLLMCYGPPGSGKTFVVIDAILSACTGKQWAMRFDVQRKLTVAYCAGEGVSGLPARFAAAAQFHGVESLPNFTFFDAAPQLYYSDDQASDLETIEHFIYEWQERQATGQAEPLDLLVIDTLHSAAVGAEENSAKDMGEVMRKAKLAIKLLGCAVLLVHHSNKAGTGERGSSSMRGAMDCMLEVKPTAGKYALNCEKLKDGQQWKPQTFDLVAVGDTESVRVWWDEPGELATGTKTKQHKEQIVAMLKAKPGVRYTASTLGEAVGLGKSKRIFALLSDLVSESEEILCALKEPEKDSSPHNPLMYWYQSREA